MAFTLEIIQEDILSRLETNLVQKVYEIAIPDVGTIQKDESGEFNPYVAVQFGDLQREGSRNMATTRGDNHIMPVYVQSVGPDARTTRQLYNRVINILLGYSVPHGGEMKKRAGGPMFPLAATTGAVEGFIQPCSWGVPVEIREV